MRDNSKRFSAGADPVHTETSGEAGFSLDFSVPTELVDLPSKGIHYPEGSYLRGKESIEIKFMTAKDEDILTSPTLLKKGLAIDRFLRNVIIDKKVNVKSLLTGDRNAILVTSRINGFGAEYTTKVSCPACATISENAFDLSEVVAYHGDDFNDHDITPTGHGTFVIKLPRTKFEVEVRLLTSKDEDELAAKMQSTTKKGSYETHLTDQLRKIIVSVNGVEELKTINQVIDVMPAFDSRYLRAAYLKTVPGLDMTQGFTCSSCGFEKEVDIPMTVDFFWSKQ